MLKKNVLIDNSLASVHAFETKQGYKAYTKFAFLITESILVSQLIEKELSVNQIKRLAIDDDILQIRSKVSRQGAFKIIQELLETVPKPYIKFLAFGNSDIRKFTFLCLNLRINRLLREVISELLIDRLKRLNYSIEKQLFQGFFELKRDQEIVLRQWSDSTYQKACSNTILILVRSGLLTSNNNKKIYEIQAMPLPFGLKQQLLLDGLEFYVKLMLN